MLNLTQLRTFWMVAKTGSFRAAAEELNVAQPALTRQVKDLEAVYGVVLLNRSGRGSETTEAGKQLFERADKIFQDVQKTETFLKNMTVGYLNFHAVSHVSIPGIVSHLNNKISVPVQLTMAPSLDVRDALLNETCDIGLLTLNADNHEVLEVRPVGSFNLLCVIPKGHHLSGRKELSVLELEKEKIVTGTIRTQTRKVFDAKMSEYGVNPVRVFEVNDRFTVSKMATELNAVGIYSDTGYGSDLFKNSCHFSERDMRIPVSIAAHRRRLKHSHADSAFRFTAELLRNKARLEDCKS